ncbi:MAG: DUF3488 and transglutaminase-like domain-containing protein [Planctomycetota bacterium]|nr:DUF3488 and transglutaminase-like domain-containing protein [Planctomycetota bacterium]
MSIGITSSCVADPTPLAVIMFLVTAPLVGGAYYFTEHRRSFYLPSMVASGLATIAFFVSLGVVLSWLSVLLPFLHFLSFAQCMRLWQKKNDREYSNLFVVSLIQIACGASISLDIQFGLMFFIYLFLAFWTLILFYIKRVASEETGILLGGKIVALQGIQSSQIRGALGSAIPVMLAFLLISMLGVFAILPRYQIRVLSVPTPRGRQTGLVGFSEQVRLGQIGQIKDNDELVMRVKLSRNGKAIELPEAQLYWRGMSADSYVYGSWRETVLRNYWLSWFDHESGWKEYRAGWVLQDDKIFPFNDRKWPVLPNSVELETSDLRQEISLENTGTNRIFSLYPPIRIDLGDQAEGMKLDVQHWNARFIGRPPRYYVVHSRPQEYTQEQLNQELRPGQRLPSLMRTYFIRNPQKSPKLLRLAENIALSANAETSYQKSVAVKDWLEINCKYTRLPGVIENPRRNDPVLHFLFKSKKGHCEYFASAQVLLCRSLEVPARIVNGFRGGDWNQVGKFYQVRQNHAHSWAEVYLPEVGWYPLDPSGSDLSEENRIAGAGLGQYFDWGQNLWDRFIVGYTPKKLGFSSSHYFENLAFELRSRLGGVGGGSSLQGMDSVQAFFAKLAFAIAAAASLYVIITFLPKLKFRLFRFSSSGPGYADGSPTVDFYRELLAYLKKRGYVRISSQTPAEFASDVDHRTEVGESVQRLTDIYYGARYSGRALTDDQNDEARRLLESVRKTEIRNASAN